MAHNGVKRLPDGRWEVRASAVDQRTGKLVWRRRRIQGTKREAEALREQLRTELHEHGSGANPTRQRLEDFAESWLRSKSLRVKVSTANRYADALAHALPHLGSLYVDAITVRDIEKWLSLMAPTAQPPTVNGWLRVVKTCVGDACVELGLPDFVKRVKPLPEPPPRRHGLTPGQLRRLLGVYDHDPIDQLAAFAVGMTPRGLQLPYMNLDHCDIAARCGLHRRWSPKAV